MSIAGIRRISEALEELLRELPGRERTVQTRRADLAKAEETLETYRRTIAAYRSDIEELRYAERLTKLYGRDPRQ